MSRRAIRPTRSSRWGMWHRSSRRVGCLTTPGRVGCSRDNEFSTNREGRMAGSREKPTPPQWSPSSPPVEAEQFEDVIAGATVIVHFWAPWNPYDKQLDANLQQ